MVFTLVKFNVFLCSGAEKFHKMPLCIENSSFKVWANTAFYNPLLGSLFHHGESK